MEQEAVRREAMQAFFADGADEEEGTEGPVVWAAVLGVAAVAGGGLAACLLGYLQWQLALLLCAAAAAAAFSMLVIGKWSKRQKTEKEKTTGAREGRQQGKSLGGIPGSPSAEAGGTNRNRGRGSGRWPFQRRNNGAVSDPAASGQFSGQQDPREISDSFSGKRDDSYWEITGGGGYSAGSTDY